jgi:tetratricopeptide (TPR) repeat protein
MSLEFENDREAIWAVVRCSCYGAAPESFQTRENMDRILDAVGRYTPIGVMTNPHLAYWLGIAWRNYTSWHVRGEARKPFLERSIRYFRKAFELSKELPVSLPEKERHVFGNLDQITIASNLGSMLMNEKLVRDLEAAEKVLTFVWNNTPYCEPSLYSYLHLFYQKGEYLKSVDLALELYERTKQFPVFQGRVPLTSLGYAARAYRALGNKAKREGRFDIAYDWYSKIEDPFTTANDAKILDRLEYTQWAGIHFLMTMSEFL